MKHGESIAGFRSLLVASTPKLFVAAPQVWVQRGIAPASVGQRSGVGTSKHGVVTVPSVDGGAARDGPSTGCIAVAEVMDPAATKAATETPVTNAA